MYVWDGMEFNTLEEARQEIEEHANGTYEREAVTCEDDDRQWGIDITVKLVPL